MFFSLKSFLAVLSLNLVFNELNLSTMAITTMRIAIIATCPDKDATSRYQYGISASLSQRAFSRY